MKHLSVRNLHCDVCLSKGLPRKNTLCLTKVGNKIGTKQAGEHPKGITPHLIYLEHFYGHNLHWSYLCGVCGFNGEGGWQKNSGSVDDWNENRLKHKDYRL